jgi:hypothetical protein
MFRAAIEFASKDGSIVLPSKFGGDVGREDTIVGAVVKFETLRASNEGGGASSGLGASAVLLTRLPIDEIRCLTLAIVRPTIVRDFIVGMLAC